MVYNTQVISVDESIFATSRDFSPGISIELLPGGLLKIVLFSIALRYSLWRNDWIFNATTVGFLLHWISHFSYYQVSWLVDLPTECSNFLQNLHITISASGFEIVICFNFAHLCYWFLHNFAFFTWFCIFYMTAF